MKRIAILLLVFVLTGGSLLADEGMWLPTQIKNLVHPDMQKLGVKLSPEQIYDINNASLKDAIVSLGGFCTGEIISPQGLMLTNHHCAFGVIQDNSTLEHDYLTDGFWAKDKSEELVAPGLTASFLVRMEDVSDIINAKLSDDMSIDEREKIIKQLSDSLVEAATKDTHYNARVKSFFHGNDFYLLVYETFKDVRLVGAPPSSIGKFGGDTDNWMWPRHTGDFSLFRVYMSPDGKPAEFSQENVPLKPKHFLPISLEGVEKGDFAMIMGFPGSTDRYLSSYGVQQELTKRQPAIVKIRDKRLALMKEDMDANPAVRIQYASKYAQVSNYYKYFKGQIKGLKRLKVYDKKKNLENIFTQWVNENEERKKVYGNALSLIEEGYKESDNYILSRVYLGETVFGSEILRFSYGFMQLQRLLEEENNEKVKAIAASLKKRAENFYKDYNAPTDKKITAAMLELYYNDLPKEQQPEYFRKLVEKNKSDFNKISEYLFAKSILDEQDKVMAFLDNPDAKTLKKDAAFNLFNSFFSNYMKAIRPQLSAANAKIDKGMRLFTRGLREMQTAKKFYPDANSTLRLTYGTVQDYYPKDAVYYNYYTTIEGIMEKEDPSNPEFVVPEKLKELYKKKDY
ncbi:MAG: S46 family peptidase, partial [Bacteroidetes bacterium]